MASDALVYLLPCAHFDWNRMVDLAGLSQRSALVCLSNSCRYCCSLSNLALAVSQAAPTANQKVAVARSETQALTGPSFGFFQAKDGSVQLKPKGFFENFSH